MKTAIIINILIIVLIVLGLFWLVTSSGNQKLVSDLGSNIVQAFKK